MKTIYFVRHGDKVIDIGNVGLTEVGKKQAENTANFFKKKSIDYLLSSPYKRTAETANIISSNIHIPVIFDERLKERMFFGEIPNINYQQYISLCAKSSIHRDYILPNGVSSYLVGKRVTELVDEIINSNHTNIVIVSHLGTIADYIRNIFSKRILREQQPEFVKTFDLKLASITAIAYTNLNARILTLGSTLHLDKF